MSASTPYLPTAVLVERMMRRVEVHGTCWLFRGAVNSKGYGCVASGRKGKTILTHRLVVLHRDGELADEMTVDHLCGERTCVNPDHLEVVTRSENSRRGNRPWVARRFRELAQMDGAA